MHIIRSLMVVGALLIFSLPGHAQLNRIGGGLSFSSGVDFNAGSSGNPGLNLKAYYRMNKRFFIKPELTVFNRFNKGSAFYSINTYMFHLDIDGQYGLIREDKIVLYGFAGINATSVISRYKEYMVTGGNQLSNDSSVRPGLNIGASLKMYVNRGYDGMLQVKYIAGSFDQLVISMGVIYHLDVNTRRSW